MRERSALGQFVKGVSVSAEDKRRRGAAAMRRWRQRHPEKNRQLQIERESKPGEKERVRQVARNRRKKPDYNVKHREYLSLPHVKEKTRRYRETERFKNRMEAWTIKNESRLKAQRRALYLKNPAAYLARCRARQMAQKKALPKWANLEAIKQIYIESRRLGMEVDHIIPIKHKLVCGLHVEYNLQLLTPKQNREKLNRWPWTPK